MTPEQQALADACTNLQRLMVLGLVEGKSQRQAYYDAGGSAKNDESADATASEILRNPSAKAFYDSMMRQAVERTLLTVEDLLRELEEARAAALHQEKPQAAAMVAATMGKAKILGLEAPSKLELTGANGGPVKMKTLNDFYSKDNGES